MKRICLFLGFILAWINCIAGVRYTTANLNLREEPSTNCRIVTTIPKGTPVTIDEDCDCTWIAVEYKGYIGYVSSKYLSCYYETACNESSGSVNRQIQPQRTTYYHPSPTSTVRHYCNVDGYRVQSPTYYNGVPAGATAICRDGTYSFSKHRRGTCSHHGGVARWL